MLYNFDRSKSLLNHEPGTITNYHKMNFVSASIEHFSHFTCSAHNFCQSYWNHNLKIKYSSTHFLYQITANHSYRQIYVCFNETNRSIWNFPDEIHQPKICAKLHFNLVWLQIFVLIMLKRKVVLTLTTTPRPPQNRQKSFRWTNGRFKN